MPQLRRLGSRLEGMRMKVGVLRRGALICILLVMERCPSVFRLFKCLRQKLGMFERFCFYAVHY